MTGKVFSTNQLVTGGVPYLIHRGRTGCLLIHGFSSMPEELDPLAGFLADQGFTVYNARMAGHGSKPADLARTRWTDWLISVEEGLSVLSPLTERVFILGLSMGGVIALLSAARYPVAGVISFSAPYGPARWKERFFNAILPVIRPYILKRKGLDQGPYGDRREPEYPAYAVFPSRIMREFTALQDAMRAELPNIKAPALIIQSRDDHGIGDHSCTAILNALGSSDKQAFWLEDAGHAIPRSPKGRPALVAAAEFIHRISTETE